MPSPPGQRFSSCSLESAAAIPDVKIASSVDAGWSSVLLEHHQGTGSCEPFVTVPTPDQTIVVATRGDHELSVLRKGKWRRALLTSTQLSTYFVGYTEVAAIAAARPFGATPKAWHDAMLAHGSPPPRHLRTLLGV